MKLDADDLIHRDLARYVSDRKEDGFIINRGFFYRDGMRTIQADNRFNKVCGSSSMIWLNAHEFPASIKDDPRDFDILQCGHNIFDEFYRERNKMISNVPFRAAIYLSGNGENISGHDIKSIKSRKKALLSLLKRRPLMARHTKNFSLLDIRKVADLVRAGATPSGLPLRRKDQVPASADMSQVPASSAV
jgi:hypothetical protein